MESPARPEPERLVALVPTAPPTDQFEQAGSAIVQRARALEVRTHADLELAAAELQKITRLQDGIHEALDPIADLQNKAHKATTGLRARLLAGPEEARQIIRGKVGAYEAEQERVRRELEAKAAAEQKRLQDEAALREATALADAGETEAALAIVEEAANAPAPIVEIAAPKVEGLSFRSEWGFQVVDRSKIDPRFMVPDLKAIAGVVRSMKKNAEQIVGGIRVSETKTPITRR